MSTLPRNGGPAQQLGIAGRTGAAGGRARGGKPAEPPEDSPMKTRLLENYDLEKIAVRALVNVEQERLLVWRAVVDTTMQIVQDKIPLLLVEEVPGNTAVAEQIDTSKYYVERRTQIRKHFALTSAVVGYLDEGTTILSLQEKTLPKGGLKGSLVFRIKCRHDGVTGWVSTDSPTAQTQLSAVTDADKLIQVVPDGENVRTQIEVLLEKVGLIVGVENIRPIGRPKYFDATTADEVRKFVDRGWFEDLAGHDWLDRACKQVYGTFRKPVQAGIPAASQIKEKYTHRKMATKYGVRGLEYAPAGREDEIAEARAAHASSLAAKLVPSLDKSVQAERTTIKGFGLGNNAKVLLQILTTNGERYIEDDTANWGAIEGERAAAEAAGLAMRAVELHEHALVLATQRSGLWSDVKQVGAASQRHRHSAGLC